MIYDCFTFYNEFDILELRLNELAGVVDRFVLVEADKTHAGADKPLFFAENRERFAPWADKIIHVAVRDMPQSPDSWVLENFQRNAITRGLTGSASDDIILVSDVDEILRAGVVASLPASPAMLFGFRMPMFYFKFNYMNVTGEPHMVWSVGGRGAQIAAMSPQGARNARFSLMDPAVKQTHGDKVQVIDHAGWHFSYLGNNEHVRNKLTNFAHQEFNTPGFIEAIDIDTLIRGGRDIFGRPGFTWQAVALNGYFPEHVQRNLDRYRPFIIEAAPAA